MRREREQATEKLEVAESELSNLRAALARAREGEEAERRCSERESKRVAALRKELEASESRLKIQEEEIALVRKQVRLSQSSCVCMLATRKHKLAMVHTAPDTRNKNSGKNVPVESKRVVT